MRIYYDELAKNIVLGQSNRLFATGSLEASEFRGRVSIVYKDTNFRELFLAHNRILKEDGTRAGQTIDEVLDYLNTEFNKSPFDNVVANGLVLVAQTPLISYKVLTTDAQGFAVHADAGTLDHADQVVGVAKNSGTTLSVAESGEVSNPGWNWTPGQALFLGLNGDIVTTPRLGVFNIQIGYAKTAQSIIVKIGRSIILG